MLVVGVGFVVGKVDQIGEATDALEFLFVFNDTRPSLEVEIVEEGRVFGAVVVGRAGYGDAIGGVFGEAEPVVVGLNAVVGVAVEFGTAGIDPWAIEDAGDGLVVFGGSLASEAEGEAGGGGEVALVGGIDESSGVDGEGLAGGAVQQENGSDATGLPRDMAGLGVELGVAEDGDVIGLLLKELLKDGLGDMRFELMAPVALAELGGIGPEVIGVVANNALAEFGKEATGGTALADIGGPEAIGGETAEVGGALGEDDAETASGGANGGSDAGGGGLKDEQVAGAGLGLGRHGIREEGWRLMGQESL